MDFFVGNFADWFNSYARDKLFRLWYKEDEKLGLDDGYDGVCQYVYLRQAINLGNDWLIGYAVFDEREKDNMYPSLNWARLSELIWPGTKMMRKSNFPLYNVLQRKWIERHPVTVEVYYCRFEPGQDSQMQFGRIASLAPRR